MTDVRGRVKALERAHGNGKLEYVIMFKDQSGVFRNSEGEIFLPESEEGLWRSTFDDHQVQGWIVMSEDLRDKL